MVEARGTPSELFRMLEDQGLRRLPSLENALGYGLAAQIARRTPDGVIDAVELFIGAGREDPFITRVTAQLMDWDDFYSIAGLGDGFFPEAPPSVLESGIEDKAFAAIEAYVSDPAQFGASKSEAQTEPVFGSRELAAAILWNPGSELEGLLSNAGVTSAELAKAILEMGPSPEESVPEVSGAKDESSAPDRPIDAGALKGHADTVLFVAITPDGRYAVTTSSDETARVWDLSTGATVQVFEDHTERVGFVAITPDGQKVVTASDDQTARVWDLNSGDTIHVLQGHTRFANFVAITPDGQRAVTTSSNQTARVWDISSGETIHVLKGHTDRVSFVTITADGRSAIATSTDNTARVWDLTTGTSIYVLEGHTQRVNFVAIAADGRHAVTTSDDHTARVWDLTTGETTHLLKGHTNQVWFVAITPDGRSAVTASDDNTARVWDVGNGETVHVLTGHTDEVWFVAITPDGRSAVTTSNDHTARVWDLSTGVTTHVLKGHTDLVTFVAITPDGRHAVTASSDATARLWDLATGLAVPRIEDWAPPRRATPSDRIDIVHDEPATRAEEDRLNRYALAQLVAVYMRRFRDDEPRTSFLLHIDGPWGSGKSTLLRFLEAELVTDQNPPWLIVSLDAWRESKLDSAAFSLLGALRREVRATKHDVGRVGFFVRERWRFLGSVNKTAMFVALMVLVVALLAVFLWSPDVDSATTLLPLVALSLSVVAVVWSGSRAAARVITWNTPAGLTTFLQRERDPMATIADQFRWLLQQADRPILFLIDDLDRCHHKFVVELLDSVQTLMRDAPTDSQRRIRGVEQSQDPNDPTAETDRPGKAFVFVVAADGRWIRQSYEVAHKEFIEAVAQPGQPLGYLFLDKLFQLTVPVPGLSPARQERFLASVLKSPEVTHEPPDDSSIPSRPTSELREALDRSSTESEVIETLGAAAPHQRLELAPQAISKLAEREVPEDTEHVLRPFALLLAPNPRSVKRFVMDYAATRGARTAEGSAVGIDKLAQWTVIRTRWPALADYLRANPHQVSVLGTGAVDLEKVPEDLHPLFVSSSGDVRAVLDFNGSPFTPDDVRACTGTYDLQA